MAGQWIKFDVATSDKPEVWAMATELNIDPDAVVGKLMRVWAWFDDQTEQGNAPSVTTSLLDRRVGVTGFCQSMINVNWMILDSGEVLLPHFDRHNGKTSKNRSLTAKRVAEHKAKTNGAANDSVTLAPLPHRYLEKRREEKRREEVRNKLASLACSTGCASFEDFWSLYPKRVGKTKAIEAWAKRSEADRALALTDLSSRVTSDPQWLKDKGQFIPHPTTYLNNARWLDEWQPRHAGISANGSNTIASAKRFLAGEPG